MVNTPMQNVAIISKLYATRVSIYTFGPKECGCDNQILYCVLLFKSNPSKEYEMAH